MKKFYTSEASGLFSSTVSRRFIQAGFCMLRELVGRDLPAYDFVVLFVDGKSVADDEMIVALGVIVTQGIKISLKFSHTSTEIERIIKGFFTILKS